MYPAETVNPLWEGREASSVLIQVTNVQQEDVDIAIQKVQLAYYFTVLRPAPRGSRLSYLGLVLDSLLPPNASFSSVNLRRDDL